MDTAAALEQLVVRLREGKTLRAALLDWCEGDHACEESRRRFRRRLLLGDGPATALAAARPFGEDNEAVEAAVRISLVTGASLSALLDGSVTSIRRREEDRGSAGAGSAGALLSARLIAGLPLAFVPFVPAAEAPFFDVTGSALLVLGIGLCVAGLRWVSALVPRPKHGDGVADAAERMAAALRAGASLSTAVVSAGVPEDVLVDDLARARRRASLGASVGLSFAWEGSPLDPIGKAIARTSERGLPLAPALEELARSRRSASQRAFERALKRAPILMVLPVTLCVLPSYVLLGLVPFVRGSFA